MFLLEQSLRRSFKQTIKLQQNSVGVTMFCCNELYCFVQTTGSLEFAVQGETISEVI